MIAALTSGGRDRGTCFVSIVMPVYNEVAILQQLTDSVFAALQDQCAQLEIVYVNDGSADGSRELLDQLAAGDDRIVVVHLSRNFGHQPAVNAGLHHATGDVVVLMDSDLQDDPHAIPQMLSTWEDGFDVVYAERFNRKESLPKRVLFHSFYRVLNAVADSPIPQDAGNFSLMDGCVVDAMKRLPERDLYLPGLRSWTGFRQTGIPVERLARHDDQPRVSLCGLFRLAKTAIFSFSTVPLTLFYGIAALSGLVCAGSVGFVLYHKLLSEQAVPGWTSVIITASFFGALNALGISVLGEYVIRIYDEVRARPIYLTDQKTNYNSTSRPSVDRSQPVDRVLGEIESQWNGRVNAEVAGH